MFVVARKITTFFGVRLLATLNWVNFGGSSPLSSLRHGVPEPIRFDMDVSGRILRAWMPAIHAGMTEIFSSSVGERKLMNTSW
jgi:hypothetical protein